MSIAPVLTPNSTWRHLRTSRLWVIETVIVDGDLGVLVTWRAHTTTPKGMRAPGPTTARETFERFEAFEAAMSLERLVEMLSSPATPGPAHVDERQIPLIPVEADTTVA